MTNEEILKSRWSSIDKQLEKYLKVYKKVNQKTKDKLQTIFDSLNITYSDINKNVPPSVKKRLDRYIIELKEKGLLRDYFGYTARLLLSRKNISYRELIEFIIMAAYIEEHSELEGYNQVFFYNICEYSYKQGIKDISKTKKIKHNSFDLPLFYTLMNIPLLGVTAKAYLYSISLTNANETYKQYLINMQLNRALNINDGLFRNLFTKQMKRFISINEGKYSGGIVNVSENLVNSSYLQAGIDNDVEQCRFIAEMDDRTTKMCESLDNQLFYLNKINVYQRYSDADKKYVTYHTKGLVLGENLPPITNHFHWCRSTITYQIGVPRTELNKDLQTFNEKAAINKWLSSDFYSINQKMYNSQRLTDSEKRLVKELYRGLNKEPYYVAKDDELIVRALDADDNAIKNIISTYKINEVYETKAFESFSIKSNYNPKANVFIYVKNSKRARNMLKYNPEEAEVLYQYGTKFITKEYYNQNGKHYFLLEEYYDE